MKNQNDIILIIVAFLIAAIGITVIYFTKPEPEPAKTVEQPVTTPVEAQPAVVVMANSLPGGGGSGSTGGGASKSGPPAGMAGGPGSVKGGPTGSANAGGGGAPSLSGSSAASGGGGASAPSTGAE